VTGPRASSATGRIQNQHRCHLRT